MPEPGNKPDCPKCKINNRVVFVKSVRYHFCTGCQMIVGFEVLEPQEGVRPVQVET